MAWGLRNWTRYGGRHFAVDGIAWKDQIDATKGSGFAARYLPDFDVQELEMRATEYRFLFDANNQPIRDANGRHRFELVHGRCMRPNDNFWQIYLINDSDVGASSGKITRITLVQWDQENIGGAIHGHPVTKEDIEKKLKKQNPPELDYFREVCRLRGIK